MAIKDTKAYFEEYTGNEAEEQNITLLNSFISIMLQDNAIPKECQKWLQTFWVTQT